MLAGSSAELASFHLLRPGRFVLFHVCLVSPSSTQGLPSSSGAPCFTAFGCVHRPTYHGDCQLFWDFCRAGGLGDGQRTVSHPSPSWRAAPFSALVRPHATMDHGPRGGEVAVLDCSLGRTGWATVWKTVFTSRMYDVVVSGEVVWPSVGRTCLAVRGGMAIVYGR